jgi:citrate lyase subunit beta/citryl-CoA lyase
MANDARPIRTLLRLPGTNEERMREVLTYGADAVVYTLEKAVAPAKKPEARRLVRKLVDELGPKGYTFFVKLNGLDSGETARDLEAVISPHLHAVELAGVRGPRDVVAIDALLEAYERDHGVPVGQTLLVPLLETAAALHQAFAVASASPRVDYMGFAPTRGGDVARAIGYQWTPQGLETLFLRSKILVEGRAAGVRYPLTGFWSAVGDLEGMRAYALQGRQLGYTGMMCSAIRSHVELINEVFSPTPAEIAEWQSLIARIAQAERETGSMLIEHDGFMVAPDMALTAQQQLDFARRLGLLPT